MSYLDLYRPFLSNALGAQQPRPTLTPALYLTLQLFKFLDFIFFV